MNLEFVVLSHQDCLKSKLTLIKPPVKCFLRIRKILMFFDVMIEMKLAGFAVWCMNITKLKLVSCNY